MSQNGKMEGHVGDSHRSEGSYETGPADDGANAPHAAVARGLIEAFPDAVLICDLQGTVRHVNAAAAALYNTSVDELVGRAYVSLVDEEYHAFWECGLRSVAGGETFEAQSVHRRPDGVEIPVEERVIPIDKDGKTLAAVVVRDITARKNRERELLATRDRYQRLYEQANVGYFRTDLTDGALLESNENLARMFGYESSDDIFDRSAPWLHCLDPDIYQRVVDRIEDEGQVSGWQVEYLRRDGTVAWARMYCHVISEKSYLECVMADMTDEKLAAEALRRERDFAQRLLETAHTIVMVLGLTGRVLRINRYARDVTGLSESDVLGRDWFELFAPPDQRNELRQVFMKVIDGWRSVGTERELQTSQGKLAVQWYASALRDGDGKAVGLMVIGHDITEIRTKEEQLRDAAKMEAVGRLAGGIAHDFNNQLTIIKGYCDLLLRRVEGDQAIEKPLGSIVSAAMTASSLTRELLMFSRKHTLNPRLVDVNRTLTDLADPIERVLGADVALTLELDNELGAVKLDPVQFEQAMINLAANARDAMPEGGQLTIRTENAYAGSDDEQTAETACTKITIIDTGVGMTEETAEQIFEPFFTTKPEGMGSGLALASAYGFVKQSGGWIEVKSQPGQGTEFEVYLPQLDQRDLAREAGEQPEQIAKGGRTILVVEDSQAVREIVVRVLGESGYRVLQASNARNALPILDEDGDEIDLLVTDVIMPGMTGVELAHEAKRRRPDLPVLYISGYVGERLSRQGLDADRHNLLQKPFEAGDLTRAVKRLLQESHTETK